MQYLYPTFLLTFIFCLIAGFFLGLLALLSHNAAITDLSLSFFAVCAVSGILTMIADYWD